MLTTTELYEATRAVKYPRDITDRDARVAARRAYDAEIAGLEAQWREWLADEYASDLPTSVHAGLYTRAWAEGHASGYHEVENWYREFSDFGREIVEALKG